MPDTKPYLSDDYSTHQLHNITDITIINTLSLCYLYLYL